MYKWLIFSPMEYRTSKNKSSTNKKTLNGHFTTLTTDQCSPLLFSYPVLIHVQKLQGKYIGLREWSQCRERSFLEHRNLHCLPQNTNISRHSNKGRVWGQESCTLVLWKSLHCWVQDILLCIWSKYDPCLPGFVSNGLLSGRDMRLSAMATTQHRLQLSLNGPHCMPHLQVC